MGDTNTWHLKVPKIFHIYWGGDQLPYIRYMVVKSFMQQNPDWKVMFWHPKTTASFLVSWPSMELNYKIDCDNWLDKLKELPIEVNEFDFEGYGFMQEMSEVHKSDFLRLKLLSTYGGVWSDADVFYFKPIINLEVNSVENKDKETFVCICFYGHSIGFIMGTENNGFYKAMVNHSLEAYQDYIPQAYQYMASELWNKHYLKLEMIEAITPVINMKMDTVYCNNADDISAIYDGTLPKFTENSIGIHWYAGHQMSGNFLRETNGGLDNLPDNVLGNLLKDNQVKYGV